MRGRCPVGVIYIIFAFFFFCIVVGPSTKWFTQTHHSQLLFAVCLSGFRLGNTCYDTFYLPRNLKIGNNFSHYRRTGCNGFTQSNEKPVYRIAPGVLRAAPGLTQAVLREPISTRTGSLTVNNITIRTYPFKTISGTGFSIIAPSNTKSLSLCTTLLWKMVPFVREE